MLRSLVSRGKAAARKLVRARILLLADEGSEGPGKTHTEIVDALGCGVNGRFRVFVRILLPKELRKRSALKPIRLARRKSKSRAMWSRN